MNNRRAFLHKASVGGIAGIVAAGSAPVFAGNVGIKKKRRDPGGREGR